MNVKYQIFVSSSYEDLKDERNEVIKACLNMGHIPVGMEMFNAADEEQWAVITRTIDQCDYYVVIVAHRYGSTTPDGISFTEKEYNYAVEQGVPVLGFIIAEDAPWPNTKRDEQQDVLDDLKRFKEKVRQKMVRFWHTASELRSQFVESLATSINTRPRRGWTRAPEAGAADVAQILSNLTEENARLQQMLDQMRSTKPYDEIDELCHLLKSETGNLSNHDFFMNLIAHSDGGRFDNKIIIKMEPDLNPEEIRKKDKAFRRRVQHLQLLGLIELAPRTSSWTLSALGRRVFNRLELERRSKPPS